MATKGKRPGGHPGASDVGSSRQNSRSGTPNRPNEQHSAQLADLAGSNSLADLAARIRVEHEAASLSLKQSVEHAMAAGALLIEAKAQFKHGQWLPWLRDRCAMSERTAQLYMRVAKNGDAIEANAQRVADLTLNEAAALLALTSDLRKILEFAKRLENVTDPEELVEICVAEGIGVITTPGYDPLAGRSPDEAREWVLFILFLVKGQPGIVAEVDGVTGHVEWILRRRFQNVAAYLGEEGDEFRARVGMKTMPQAVRDQWAAFLEANEGRTVADIVAELDAEESRQNTTGLFSRGKRARR